MRGLTSAALLLAPALAAVAVPPVPDLLESNPTVFVTFDVPDAAKAANYVTLRLDVLESDQPCGPASLKINDQPLPQSDDADHGPGSGTFVLGPGSTMAARWNLTCLADEQLLDFSVDLVDGTAVPDATFAVRFVQTAPAAVLDAEGPAVRVSLSPPISPDAVAKSGCSGNDADDVPAELDEMHLRKMEMHAALRELDFLRAALADLTALVEEKERFVAVEFGKDAKLHKGGIAECDSIKCVVGNVVGKVAGAASFVYGELVGSGSGPGRHHRRPPHHRHFFPWPPRHGNHSHPHPPGGNHTHGNHTWPHPPFRPPHWLPPCHCPPPHHPPPHHPPPHHPPPHHKPPHHPPPDGPPEGPPEGPPDGPPPPFDGPPPPPPHHGGPPPPPPDFDGPPPPPDFDGPPPPPGFPPPPLGFPPPPPGFPPPPPPGFPPPPPPFDGPPPPPPHGREGFFPPPPGMDERPMIGDDHRWSRPRPGPGGGPPRGHHGPPPFRAHIHRLLILAAVVFLAASLLGMLHRRFCGGARRLTREDRRTLRAARRTAWHRRRDARRAKWASRRARLAALCGRLFGLGDSAADDEEKEAMLRARSSSASSVDGSVIESDLTQLRNAADVVGSLVAAEEGRVARREQLRLEGGGVIVGLAEAVRSAPVPMPPPSPMSSFPDYVSVDEALPSYEGVSLASSVESSVVADGYRPGARVYTPSDSSEGSGVDDVLGRSPPKE